MPPLSHSGAAARSSFDLPRYASLPLRATAGGGFIEHGWAKIMKGPESFAAILQALHVPFPHLSAYLTISVELLGGAALLLGAFVAWASIPAIVVLLTAMFTVHLPYGFSSIKIKAIMDGRAQFGPPGYECDLLYIACIVTLVCLKPGPWSIDGYRLRRRNVGFPGASPVTQKTGGEANEVPSQL
jgi:putative oxidoreductase